MPDPFKFISLDELRTLDSPIVHVITEEQIQQFAEDNCGGRLNDAELRAFAFVPETCSFLRYLDEAIEASRNLALAV